ncbi:T9SS type A sorting domain-containing protein [Segetibacter sp. 3557_3]|uniref:YCF48-related protein n=1 Tax=Segetibacter sp. 3557_3 TaxID=2547429 RepID=UPI0010591B21|nr:YCF48-related protein [Segetibacter sp. 3557_3]TDH24594.1 T9SS type A sorting domain-containing protein [Segetibacter sp. 3557_3]
MKKHLLFVVAMLVLGTAGAQWQAQNAGFSNDTLGFYEMSLPDKNTAWAVCYDGKGGLLSGRPVLDFTRTLNGGQTWIPGKMGTDRTLRFSNITAINGQEAWVAMHKIGPVPGNYVGSFAKGGGVFHTMDGGMTWEQSNAGELFNSNSVPRFVHFKDKNHGIAVGDPNDGYWEVYLTNNKGKKWKRVRHENLPDPIANEYGWISGHAVVGNTIWFGTSEGRMYKSVDFGKTWTVHVVDPLPGTYVHEIAFLDDGLSGVAHLRGRNRTFVFSTTDGGLTWTNYFQPANWKNSRMTAVPGTNAFISTAVHGNPIFQGSAVSYDVGQTWIEIDNDADKAVCRFYDAQTGYAGGFFQTGPPFLGGIFKSEINFQHPGTAPKLSTSERSISERVTNESATKVFPTPATSTLTLLLDDDLVTANTIVNIVGMDGKIISTRKSAGVKSLNMDVRELVPGTYILRITGNGQTINRRFTVTR